MSCTTPELQDRNNQRNPQAPRKLPGAAYSIYSNSLHKEAIYPTLLSVTPKSRWKASKKISGPNGMCDIALAVMPETFIDDKHL